MNQVLHAGAETAAMGTLLGFTTVVFIASLVGWTLWAWWPTRREELERAGRLPLEEDR